MNSIIESVVHDYLKWHPAYYDGEDNNIDGEGRGGGSVQYKDR